MFVPVESRYSQPEGDAPVDLLGLEVEHRRALFHGSSSVRSATDDEEGFGDEGSKFDTCWFIEMIIAP